MASAGTRILPFALASAALHAVVLASVPDALQVAVSPPGHTGAVSVRLLAAGPKTPDPSTAGDAPGADRPASGPNRPEPAADRAGRTTSTGDSAVALRTASMTARSGDTVSTEQSPPGETPASEADAETASGSPERTAPASERPSEPDTRAAAANETDRGSDPSTAQNSASGAAAGRDRETRSGRPASEPADAAPQRSADDRTTPAGSSRQPPRASTKRGEPAADTRDASAGSGAAGKSRRSQLASRARQNVTVRFREQFRYPRIARQRGWEGHVVLAFRVHADGRITDVEVVESSGRAILDESARQTLIHIQNIPELAEHIEGGPLELEVPVTYRLQPA